MIQVFSEAGRASGSGRFSTTSTWVQYKQIISKPMPMCGGGAVLFIFGTECTQITIEKATDYIVRSDDMCINPGGLYTSASYRAYTGKFNGNLIFSSVLTHIPQLYPPGQSCPNAGRAGPYCF